MHVTMAVGCDYIYRDSLAALEHKYSTNQMCAGIICSWCSLLVIAPFVEGLDEVDNLSSVLYIVVYCHNLCTQKL